MEKFFGEKALERVRDNVGTRFLPKDAGERVAEDQNFPQDYFLPLEMMKCPEYDGTPYKMADIYPTEYEVMAEVPDTAGLSSLPIVDGLFKSCAGLTTLPETVFKTGVSATEFARDCVYLEDASWVILPAQDLDRAFFGCRNLRELPGIDWTRVSNAFGCFWGCENLPAEFPQVVDLSGMSDKGNWRGMFAESGARLVYVRGYDLIIDEGYSSAPDTILLYNAWAKWCEGEGTENNGITTITLDMPDSGFTGAEWPNGTVYAIPEGTYTVVAPTELFENYVKYRNENKALWLSWELTLGDQFHTDIDIENGVSEVSLNANELAVAQEAKYKQYLTECTYATGQDGFSSLTSAKKQLYHVDLQNPDYLADEEDPVYARNFARTLAAGNSYGMPWHETRYESTSTYTSNGETHYKICPGDTVTYYVKHHNDQTMKLAVRLK